jgi:putative toxin-antitoxin system antitoxin component (TIGR02293 family)
MAMSNPIKTQQALSDLSAYEQRAKKMALTPNAYKMDRDVLKVLNIIGFTPSETRKLVFGSTKSALKEDAIGLLTKTQSDRAFRIANVTLLANRVFGDITKAFLWLRRENQLLDGKTPISSLETEAGSRAVEDILIRIDHGIAA